MPDEVEAPKSEASRVNDAFKVVIQAIDLAMKDEFPKGVNSVEYLMAVKGALQFVSNTLKQMYPDADAEIAAEEQAEETHQEVETVPTEPNTAEPATN